MDYLKKQIEELENKIMEAQELAAANPDMATLASDEIL